MNRCLTALAGVLAAGALSGVAVAQETRTSIGINDKNVFPENLSHTSDGTIFIGGQVSAAIYKVPPGGTVAETWLKKGTHGMFDIFGILVEERTNTLWVCSTDRRTKTRDETALVALDLKTGDLKGKYPFPGGGTCNDMAVARNGAVYATDTLHGRVYRLAKGGKALTEVVRHPMLVGADGIVFTPDGKLYTNTYGTGLLFRINLDRGGTRGRLTQITPDVKLVQPDGMRLGPDGTLYMTQGAGSLDIVTFDGDMATITKVKDGFLVPAGVTIMGKTAWVVETKFNYQRDPALKGVDPGTFYIHAVPLP
jgi:sugar lactone lactonase YvrE